MNTEQERADFEALERKRKGFGGDTLTRAAYEPNDEYLLPLVQARWEGYQAGRAALQAQIQNFDPPYDFLDAPHWYARLNRTWLDMRNKRIKSGISEIDDKTMCDWMNALNLALALSREALQSQDREDAERYRWLRQHPYWPEENHIFDSEELDAAIDHALRIEEQE